MRLTWIASGFTLSLTRTNQPRLPEGITASGVELLTPARATISIPSTSAQVIVAEVLPSTPFGVMTRLVALTSRVQSLDIPGTSVVSTRAIDSTQLPLDGIVRDSQYLVLVSDAPIAYAYGQVRSGMAIANARVTSGMGSAMASPLGVRDLTRLDGLFVVPVAANPAAPFALVPRSITSGDGAAMVATTSPEADTFVNAGVLELAAQPPHLMSVTPADGAQVDAGAVVVQATFDVAIDPESVAGAIRLTNLAAGTVVAGAVAPNGPSTVRFTPAQPLPAGARYSITIERTIRASTGALFGQTAFSQFSTRALPPDNTTIKPDRISITIPDANGKSIISGRPGALPAGATALAVRRGRFFIESYQAIAAGDGSFSFAAGHLHAKDRIATTDTIDLQVLDVVSKAIIAVIELTPFVAGDGRGFIAPPDRETRFLSADNIRVIVPAGAFDSPTLVEVKPATKDAFAGVPNFDTELGYATSVAITFEGVANKPLDLELPVPSGFDAAGRDWLLGYLGHSVRGPRIAIADLVHVDGTMFKTGPAPTASGARHVATDAAIFGAELRQYMMRLERSGIYATVDFTIPGTGMIAGVLSGFQSGFDLFWNTLEALYAPFFYLTENQGRIVIPVVAGRPFTIVGVDPATGLDAFQRVYDPLLPSGGPVDLPNPYPDRIGPYPVFGTPFRVESVEVSVEGVPLRSIAGFTLELRNGTITAETMLPREVSVTMMNVTRGKIVRRAAGLSVEGAIGDRIVLLVGQQDVDPYTPLSIVFNEPLGLPAEGDEAIDQHLEGLLGVETRPASGGTFTDITSALRFRLESNGTRVVIELPASLTRGAEYRVRISADLADRSGLKIGQIRDEKDKVLGGLTEPLALGFQVREPGGKRASFDLELGIIRDQALSGNVLLVSALDGGIVAYDVANPAGMGPESRPLGRAPATTLSYWGLATDHHGRVYATGVGALFNAIRSFRVEDFLPLAGSGGATREVPIRGAGIVSFVPGASGNLALDSRTITSDRPEAIPRKLQLLVQDDELFRGSGQQLKEGFGATSTATTSTAGGELEVLTLDVARNADLAYATQRVTVQNTTLDMSWSADATLSTPAHLAGIVARAGDELRVIRNRMTYGVVSLFGFGVGVFDLNAMENNDAPENAGPIKELVYMTNGKVAPGCEALPEAIPDLTYTPEATMVTRPGSSDLHVLALDTARGVLDLAIPPPPAGRDTPFRCDARGQLGLRFRNVYIKPGDPPVYEVYDHPRLARLRTLFTDSAGRAPTGRFTGTAPFRWSLASTDNRVVTPATGTTPAIGQRGSEPGQAVSREYMLIPGFEYGLLVVEVAGNPGPLAAPMYQPLSPIHLVDVIWIPHGAAAVRTIPGRELAAVVDGKGHVLLVDLKRIDERWGIGETDLFPTVASVLAKGIETPDPRIVWRSKEPLASGTLAPVVDPDTGYVFAGKLLEKTTSVVAAVDPRLRIRADIGAEGGLSEIGGIVPLGIEPPSTVTLVGENASLAAFRVELALPGGIDESIGGPLQLKLESEVVAGARALDTPSGWPRAHLNVPMQRVVPASMPELRYQRGYNKWVSPWIVGVADVRASEKWQWPANTTAEQKAAQGCAKCERPAALKNKPEPEVIELYTSGRLIALGADVTLPEGTPYAYLAKRLDTRIGAVPADTLRPREVQIAAHNPPLAGGALQETTYVHSGEIETASIDLDAGGHGGLNVFADRTYRSRTIGGTAFGAGWDSMLFRRLRALPNGNVEYRDGAGEVWLFKRQDQQYLAPVGLFLKLSSTSYGWVLVDQQRREVRFDALGRLIAETDYLYDNEGGGNLTRYLYDDKARLGRVIDPVGRETSIRYNAQGLVEEIRDWHGLTVGPGQAGELPGRKVEYSYEDSRLTEIKLPEAKAADGVPAEFDHSGAKRPRIVYTYDDGASSATLNDTIELKTNLKTITDPAEVASSGPPRVRFNYAPSGQDRDRVKDQRWATDETATFTYLGALTTVVDALKQSRTYSLTNADLHDKRVHVSEIKTDVPILQYAEANLPSAARPDLAADVQTLTTSMFYRDDGQLDRIIYPNLLRVVPDYEPAKNGAPGTIVVKTTETGPAFASRETRYTHEASANLIDQVGRLQGESGLKERLTPQPTRTKKKKKVVDGVEVTIIETAVTDEEVSVITQHNLAGQVTNVLQAPQGSEAAEISTEIRYHGGSQSSAVERSRPKQVIRGLGGSDTEKQSFAYQLLADRGERIESHDQVRGTTTVAILDSFGRTILRSVTDNQARVLSEERFGYDASGRLAYHSREQRGLGLVETRTTYDAMGRERESSITRASVDGSASMVKTTSRYEVPARRITQTYPSSGVDVPAEVVTTLDGLGRPIQIIRQDSAAQTIVQKYAYDASGERSFESDGARIAALYHHDVVGRTTVVVGTDGTKTELTYTPWGEVETVTERQPDGGLFAGTHNFFTQQGRLKSVNESTGAGARKTQFSWLEGGRRTLARVGYVPTLGIELLTPGKHRVQQTLVDPAGHVIEERVGEVGPTFNPSSMEGVWAMTTRNFVGSVPMEIRVKEPIVGAEYQTWLRHDGLGRLVEQIQAGTFTTRTEYDEASNVLSIVRPGMKAETASYDSRGLVTKRTLPDGKTNEYRYDAMGNVKELIDEAGESTFYDYDRLGRPSRIRYADGTSEETRYEDKTGAIKATRDRAGRWLAYSYDPAGRVVGVHDGEAPAPDALLIKREYDTAGRLKLVRNKDAGVEYDEYDHLGRPGVTRAYRYRAGTGLQNTPDVLDVHAQRHTWSIHDERETWRMPAAGAALPATDDSESNWLQTIIETRDAGSNLVAQARGTGGDLGTATPRSVGRLFHRRQHLSSGAAITTAYGFADGIELPGSVELPPIAVGATLPATGLPLWSETTVGSATVAGGSSLRDDALRLRSFVDFGTKRFSAWAYDDRGRLTDTGLGLTSTFASASTTDTLVDADFRSKRLATPILTPSQHASLGSEAAKIEPLTWTASRAAANQIDTRTLSLDDVVQSTRDYVFNGGRRTSDGVWSHTFDDLGRMTSATSTDRRIELTWDPNNRLVGRVAFEKDGDEWKLETRDALLSRDGLPAETTFVWDPIVDRLVAIYRQGASTQTDAAWNAGLLRQYLHGDQGYDDPTRVLVASTPGGVPTEYFPVVDDAGTGSLAAVIGQDGNLVERVLYADAYGDAPKYVQGAVADKISLQVTKDGADNLDSVEVRVHLSERIDALTLATGARLATVKADQSLAQLSSVVPELEDDFTIRWTLSATEWNLLAGATDAKSLEVSLTSALRAEGWGATPPMLLPSWARKIYSGADATTAQPVIYRESLASISSFASTIGTSDSASRTLYEIHSLYLAASEESKAKLLTGFQALPFSEPATGLVYVRARWYDPSTGTFLTPDPEGYQDSSNLYAFGAGDPVNNSDPTGRCIGFGEGTCAEWANAGKKKLGQVRSFVDKHTGSTIVDVGINAQVGFALDAVDAFVLDPLRFGDATGTAIGSGAGAGRKTLAVVQDLGRGAALAAGAGTVVKAAGKGANAVRALLSFDDLGAAAARGLDEGAALATRELATDISRAAVQQQRAVTSVRQSAYSGDAWEAYLQQTYGAANVGRADVIVIPFKIPAQNQAGFLAHLSEQQAVLNALDADVLARNLDPIVRAQNQIIGRAAAQEFGVHLPNHAAHGLDVIAGGVPTNIIGPRFGPVNSSIGSQWRWRWQLILAGKIHRLVGQ